jgi:hypothetical protein
MLKYFIPFMLLLSLPCLSQEFLFRGLPWDSSIETIIIQEGPPAQVMNQDLGVLGDIILRYRGLTAEGREVIMEINSDGNGITVGSYQFVIPLGYGDGYSSDPALAHKVYWELYWTMSERYGEPVLKAPVAGLEEPTDWMSSSPHFSPIEFLSVI